MVLQVSDHPEEILVTMPRLHRAKTLAGAGHLKPSQE
jgi:hypothetical protein